MVINILNYLTKVMVNIGSFSIPASRRAVALTCPVQHGGAAALTLTSFRGSEPNKVYYVT